jgi:hypothetical protein
MLYYSFVVTYTIGMSFLDYFREVMNRTLSIWILEEHPSNISIGKVCCKHISQLNCKPQ